MRRSWLLLVWLVVGLSNAHAQDQAPKNSPRPPAASRPAAPPGDPGALREAEALRQRASCLTNAARALESAARREPATRYAALERARAAAEQCDAPAAAVAPAPTSTTIEDIAVEWPPCNAGDPLCNDSSTFDAAPIVRNVRRHRAGFAMCGDRAAKPGEVRLLLRLAEIEDRARPVSIQVEEDTVHEPAVLHCFTRSASRLVFPTQSAAARVRLTLRTPGQREASKISRADPTSRENTM